MRSLRSRTITKEVTEIKTRSTRTKSKKKETIGKSENDTTIAADKKRSKRNGPLFESVVTSTTTKPKKGKHTKHQQIDEKSLNLSNSLNDTFVIDKDHFDYVRISDIKDSILEDDDDNDAIIETNDNKKCDVTFNVSLANGSGEWKVENVVKNMSVNNDSNVNNRRSIRKKWEKYERDTVEANAVLEQISPWKSINKIATKSTAMPDFNRMHQKMFDKMESLEDYSERKKKRAQFLLSTDKLPLMKKPSPSKENKLASRKLFTETNGYNRFGFKVRNIPEKNVEIKTVGTDKGKLFSRKDIIAIANKGKMDRSIESKREKRRDILKGVRTNRRFDLLMNMRNTKS